MRGHITSSNWSANLRFSAVELLRKLRHTPKSEDAFWAVHKWMNARRRKLRDAGVVAYNRQESGDEPLAPMTTIFAVLQWAMQHPDILMDYLEWFGRGAAEDGERAPQTQMTVRRPGFTGRPTSVSPSRRP